MLVPLGETPAGYRIMTVCEAEVFKERLLPAMGAWDIIFVLGGRVTGSGYGNKILRNEDGGRPVPLTFGAWVFLIQVWQGKLAVYRILIVCFSPCFSRPCSDFHGAAGERKYQWCQL